MTAIKSAALGAAVRTYGQYRVASRAELARRGRVQAENFSIDRYRERVGALYRVLA
jgi:hypothetical protein